MIIRQITVGMMGVCCYLVACPETKKGLIIDPGGEEDKILALCEEEGVTLEYIVATHGHPDHVCSNLKIKQATGAKIVMHEDDDAFFAEPKTVEYFSMLGLAFSPPADLKVHHGDIITIGSVSIKVLHTPGHTPGGICLYDGEANLFAGDTLFVAGVGRTDFPGGDPKQLLSSIKEHLLTLPPDTVVWPGHGYGGAKSTIGEEKASNPFLTGGWW
ncbi:MAG: MBL fold metallo-hydrolase [Desulfobulbaceae bacterium]|nr:MBL fold metallo-hydrolase [Desulfobulbaceae bacterium]